MNSTIKKVIMVFTLFCVIFLIIFCVELFLLNRGREGPAYALRAPPHTEPPPEEVEGPNETPPEEPDPAGNGTQPEDPDPERTGTLYQLEMASDIMLTVYADEELFEFTDNTQHWIFTHVDGEAELEIHLTYLPHGPSAFATTVLDIYLDGETSSIRGERQVGSSSLRGVYVTGSSETQVVSAWIMELDTVDGDNLGVAIVVISTGEEEVESINAILDTM